MEKRVVVAAILSIGILILWGWLFPPPKRQPTAPTEVSGAPVAGAEITGSQAAPRPLERPTTPSVDAGEPLEQAADPIRAEAVEEVLLKTDLLLVTLSNNGGRIVSFKLRDYTANGGEPLELLPQFLNGDEPVMLAVEMDDPNLAALLNEALYTVERRSINSGPPCRSPSSSNRSA